MTSHTRIIPRDYYQMLVEISDIGFKKTLEEYILADPDDVYKEINYLVHDHGYTFYTSEGILMITFLAYARLLRKDGYFANLDPLGTIIVSCVGKIVFEGTLEELLDDYPVIEDDEIQEDFLTKIFNS